MRESKVERDRHTRRVKNRGGLSLKFVSPQRNNVPDRLDLYGADHAAEQVYFLSVACGKALSKRAAREWAVRILEAGIQFTETKATGKKPNTGQAREHKRLRKRGFRVNVVDG